MLREGPIPRVVHGLFEYVLGVFFVAAPFLLGYDDNNMPVGVSIAIGVIILVLAAITQGPTGLVQQLPVSAHVTFDFLLAIFLIAAPFILGFSDDAAPRNLFIALGVAHLLISIGTRYREPQQDGGSAPSSKPARRASPAPSTGSTGSTGPTGPTGSSSPVRPSATPPTRSAPPPPPPSGSSAPGSEPTPAPRPTADPPPSS